jgi:hypothetical protein
LKQLLFAAVAAAVLAGCGADRTAEAVRGAVRDGDLAKASTTIAELYGTDSDEVLVRAMDEGLIQHLGGQLDQSAATFDRAVPLVDENRNQGVVDSAASWVANDTVVRFRGRAHENLQVDWFRALNHLLAAQAQDGTWRPPALLVARTPQPPVPLPAADLAPVDHRERAVNAARRLTLATAKREGDDRAAARALVDDPAARLLAAATVMALPRAERGESDEQFAAAMLTQAVKGYQAATIGYAGKSWRYEVAGVPALVERLRLRQLASYDPAAVADAPGLATARLLPGQGSVLLLNHVGFCARTEPLQIGLIAAGRAAPEPSPAERLRGASSTTFTLGALAFYAKGPGAEIANSWIALPVPGWLVQQALAPGGAAIIGFEIPVHRTDRPIGSHGLLRVDGDQGQPLVVVADLDAQARAALSDDQPLIVLRTLARVLAKQSLVAVGAKQADARDGGLLGFVVNLAGSALATWSESADLRCWLTLHDHVSAVLVDLPAGSHRLALDTAHGTVDLGEVVVAEGRLAVLSLRTFTPETEDRTDP